MSVRFRIGPFTFGKSGTRFSVWRRGSGVSIPLRKKKGRSFGKVKFVPFSYFFGGKSKKKKAQTQKKTEIEQARETYSNAYEPWTPKDDERLVELFREGKTVAELSSLFKRSENAIRMRINKLLLQ